MDFWKIAKVVAKEIALLPVEMVMNSGEGMTDSSLDDLSDGFGNVMIDDEVVSRQEAEVMFDRGELYNHKYR
ncbi:hypothetical protein [Rheinheimera fenheensis]|uniref:hypothetical protein n=1 Tax=Rheinheimera fenheensis TaxID=3152295 RepID=UPI00325D14E2